MFIKFGSLMLIEKIVFNGVEREKMCFFKVFWTLVKRDWRKCGAVGTGVFGVLCFVLEDRALPISYL